jgi:Sulfotransferase family
MSEASLTMDERAAPQPAPQTAPDRARVTSTASPYPEMTIIVGSGRSGTTYLRRLFQDCLDIGMTSEPKFVVPLYDRLSTFGDLREPANLRRLVEAVHDSKLFRHLHEKARIESRAEEILERVREPSYTGVLYATFELIAIKRGRSRLGYKDPQDIVHLPLLAELFPTARFVHIIRDGRDVARSMLKFRWGANNLYCGACYWAKTVATARRDGAALGDRYFELRHEDLILRTEEVVPALGRFVNGSRRPEQVQTLMERINQTKKLDSVDQWKHVLNARQRRVCEAAAGEVLRACGYAMEFDGQARVSPLQAAFYQNADYVLRVKNKVARKWVDPYLNSRKGEAQ